MLSAIKSLMAGMADALLPSSPPASVEDFQSRLAALSGQLPRRLQQCADHLLTHYDSIAVSTVAELSTRAGVPPSAMMRFCQILGFSGFSEMQRLFRAALSRRLPDYATRLANLKSGPAGHPAALVAEFVEAGRQSLEALARDLDETVLDQSVAALSRAKVIHLVGFRRALPVAAYLSYVFDKLGVPTVLHDGLGGLDHRNALRPGDALLAITFAPYSAETLALMDAARAAGLVVVLLTDPPAGPLAGKSTHVLVVAEADFGAFRALSATAALAIALAVAVAAKRQDHI
jgi:DNA-binding MurR/RpiR family transcriptional regulator